MLNQALRNRIGNDQNGRAGIILLPYVNSDGWTVADEHLCELWAQMKREGTLSSVFTLGEVYDSRSFIAYLRHPLNLPVLAVDEAIQGVAWMNRLEDNHGFAHFWFSKEIWGPRVLEVGREILRYWFTWRNEDGTPMLDVILGKTPATNRRAIKFIQRLGFTILGEIPKIYHGQDAVISYLTRDQVNG